MNTVAQSLSDTPRSELFQTIDQLLRDSKSTLERIQQGRDLAELAKAMIITIAVGCALFGAAMGSYRGGLQVLYAGVKLPLAMLLTTVICAPALTAFNAAMGRPSDLRQDLALVLSSLSLTSLVLSAEASLVLLAVRLGLGYHHTIILVVGCCGLAGLVGISLFLRGLRIASPKALWTVGFALLATFTLVGSQMSWTLRPFLLRPKAPQPTFIRAVEGSFTDSVYQSYESSQGHYRYSSPDTKDGLYDESNARVPDPNPLEEPAPNNSNVVEESR